MRNRNRHNRPTRCIDGRTMRHDPQPDDPELETDIGKCPECNGKGCEQEDASPNSSRSGQIQSASGRVGTKGCLRTSTG